MKTYRQLTLEQRYQIYALLKAGHNAVQTAANIGVNKSTVSRELKRNVSRRGYRPQFATRKAFERRKEKAKPRITSECWAEIEADIRSELSPEQISGKLALNGGQTVSHEWIYQHIYRDKAGGGTLYTHLRCQKKRRKRYGSYSKRGQLVNQISIEQRPAIVDQKKRIGDWEADTVIGKGHHQAIVSMVESVLIHGNTVIVMRLETVKPIGNAPLAGQTVHRRYTNIWMKEKGKWLLTARHASIVSQN